MNNRPNKLIRALRSVSLWRSGCRNGRALQVGRRGGNQRHGSCLCPELLRPRLTRGVASVSWKTQNACRLKKLHHLNAEDYALLGRLAKEVNPEDSLSDSSDELRGKGQAGIYRSSCNENQAVRTSKDYCSWKNSRHLKLMNLVLYVNGKTQESGLLKIVTSVCTLTT